MATNAYKSAGVDVEAGYKAVELMKSHVKRTHVSGVMSPIGGFGGLFLPDISGMKEPVLVSGTDGVGTKLKLAFMTDIHNTVGIDCVAMCVNDIVCSGAKPLFFLDYIATGKNIPEKIADIVSGVADGCVQAGCALIGGETAEMPGFYPEDEYDLAGFSTGIVDKSKIIDGTSLKEGDVLIGLASSGVHSNGFSLVRKLFNLENDTQGKLSQQIESLGGTLGETLLTPTKIYVKSILALMDAVKVKAVSHITGGGFYENIPRMLTEGLRADIELGSFNTLPIFDFMKSVGQLTDADLYNTFNMGIGMIVAVDKTEADKAMATLKACGETAYIIGELRAGEKGIDLR